ncbi:MAG: transcriptional regulator, TetR family [Mucilaginibacter sp.]|nr:transcriptional regulator, TetR family [Mucilaginibacter sp.]
MDKRELLLDTALRLFVEFGFHATPTSKIAKQAGIANGTLFYFFSTKDELIKALYVDIKSRMTAYILETIKDETSLYGIIKGYYSAPLYWALEHKTEFQFVTQFSNSPYLNQIAADEIQKHIQPFLDIITRGVQEGVLKPIDVDIIFALIRGHTFSINQYLIEKPFPKAEQDKVIDETFYLLWGMINNR